MNSPLHNPRRSYWLKTLHQWHWISSAVCLVGMLLFSVTGITLNHAAQIESKPEVTSRKAILPDALRAELSALQPAKGAALPMAAQRWAAEALSAKVGDAAADWSAEEIYVALPRPGGDAWLRIDRESGEAEYELTQRGWVSYFNDLHKGRHTGTAWSWFLDIFAVATLLFSVTGLFILKMHATNRPSTWPIVGLGLVIPLVLALLFIH
ncbi:MAG: hypothetical protein RLZZ618_957 [Pseudomonadota bacterium]|jgi:hypothetical protein